MLTYAIECCNILLERLGISRRRLVCSCFTNSPGLGPGRVRSSAFDLKKQKEQQQKQPKQQELLQLLLQIVVVVVFAVVIVVLLFEKCACEGGCQGASRQGHRVAFSPGGYFFFDDFHDTIFFTK